MSIATKIIFGSLILLVGVILAVLFGPAALWLKHREQQGERL